MDIPKKILSVLKKKKSAVKKKTLDTNLALASSKMGMWSWDIHSNKVICDGQLFDLLGISPKASLSTYEDFMQIIHPEDQAVVDKVVQLAIKNKSEFEVGFRIVRPDGSIHYLETKGKVYCEQGEPTLLTGVTSDMTQRRLAENELIKAKEVAEEASHAKSNFMARVSHDLRSPLNGIIGFAELMYHGKVGTISSEHKEYLGDILMSARQLLLLINDVVDLAKVEAGKLEFHPEKINIHKIIDETKSIFRNMINEKNIHFETNISDKLKPIVIDSARLKQVVYNFVSNALKCTAENGSVKIDITPNDKDSFRLSVIDTGIGIREKDQARLFIEFQQLDPSIAKKYSGTGLGLALTKHIVEAQGGTVGVKSEFGKGSEFFAILPYLN